MPYDGVGIRCTLMRGGTSKGLFIRAEELPEDPGLRDEVILAVFGSPDPRQVDGLGGGDSLTSKVAVIGRSQRSDADVDYTFGQVEVNARRIDWSNNCGNLSSAVGPYAINEGLVPAVEPVTVVRIYNTNTRKIIHAEVPVQGGLAASSGDYRIAGVPGTGPKILLNFLDSAGAKTGRLLPTGYPKDVLEVSGGRRVTVSLVDAANPAVFVAAGDVGLTGTELADEIAERPGLLDLLEEIRSAAAERLGFVNDRSEATRLSPAIPKMVIVAPPQDYVSSGGTLVTAGEISLVGRILSMQKPHKAYAVTGAICTAAAAKVPGTVVYDCVPPARREETSVVIGHPAGTIEVEVVVSGEAGPALNLERAALARTARALMTGVAHVPAGKVSPEALGRLKEISAGLQQKGA